MNISADEARRNVKSSDDLLVTKCLKGICNSIPQRSLAKTKYTVFIELKNNGIDFAGWCDGDLKNIPKDKINNVERKIIDILKKNGYNLSFGNQSARWNRLCWFYN